jgi:uncharacterized protein
MQPLGKITGRTSTHKFRFKVENSVKKWDYILANHPEVGPVLSQVLEIEASQETIAQCIIIGYRNDRGLLRKPRTPFAPGTQIFPANDFYISNILGLKKDGLYLGFLEGKSKLKAYVDPKKIITKHLAVLAKSGGGKSYAIGVLIEELASYGVPCVILDPHGEYSTIKYPNDSPEDIQYFKHYGVSSKGFASVVREFAINTNIITDATQLKLEVPQDAYAIIQAMPFRLTSSQAGLVHNTVNQIEETKAQFSFQDIVDELTIIESNAKWNLISGLQQLIKTKLFSFSPTPVNEIVKPNRVSIVNFKGSPPELQQIAAKSLLTELFEKRKLDEIPPFFLVIEEAHNFCPERGYGEAKSSAVIRSIAAEGRKFGLGLCIISQRPARVDKSVLSQCTSQMALQVTNPGDLKAISNSFEGITSETESEIRNLPIGRALLIGASDHPIFINVRVRRSQHGGRAKTFDLKKPVTEYKSGESEKIPTTKVSVSKPKPKKQIAQSIYLIEPKIGLKEIKTLEKEDIQNISVVLRPCLLANCSSGKDNFDILFDLHDLQIFSLTDKLSTIKIPTTLSNLSPIQKKVLDLASSKEQTTTSEIFVQTGLGFNEVSGVINSLARLNLINISGNKIKSNTAMLANFRKISFPLRPKYIDEPTADKLAVRVREPQIQSFLNAFNIKINSKKSCWLPFFKVKTSGGEKILDGLTYSFKI